jgi:hypothetical protein
LLRAGRRLRAKRPGPEHPAAVVFAISIVAFCYIRIIHHHVVVVKGIFKIFLNLFRLVVTVNQAEEEKQLREKEFSTGPERPARLRTCLKT